MEPGQNLSPQWGAVRGQEAEKGLGSSELEVGHPLAVQACFRSAQESYLESLIHSAVPS
jgi:hypothetical protein